MSRKSHKLSYIPAATSTVYYLKQAVRINSQQKWISPLRHRQMTETKVNISVPACKRCPATAPASEMIDLVYPLWPSCWDTPNSHFLLQARPKFAWYWPRWKHTCCFTQMENSGLELIYIKSNLFDFVILLICSFHVSKSKKRNFL